MAALVEHLVSVVGGAHVSAGDDVGDDYGHDEALTGAHVRPDVVVRPATTDEVASVLRLADEALVPVTARGSGTGLSGACVPTHGGIVVSFERMDAVLEIDTEN